MLHTPVAPFVGVWIEILARPIDEIPFDVAPFVGVWIEIPSETVG